MWVCHHPYTYLRYRSPKRRKGIFLPTFPSFIWVYNILCKHFLASIGFLSTFAKTYNIIRKLMDISKVIKKHGKSISDVAESMNISKGTLSNMLSRGNMTVDTLRRIARAVGCNIAEFFADEIAERSVRNVQLTAFVEYQGQIRKADNFRQLADLTMSIYKDCAH